MNNIKVICGALVFRKDKFVLVKEAQKQVYGKWNYPAGHLDFEENILEAAIREVKEETGLDVELEGLLGIYQTHEEGNNAVIFIFKAIVIRGNLKYAKGELLDAKWFTYEEFSRLKDIELRSISLRKAVEDCKNRVLYDLNILDIIV